MSVIVYYVLRCLNDPLLSPETVYDPSEFLGCQLLEQFELSGSEMPECCRHDEEQNTRRDSQDIRY